MPFYFKFATLTDTKIALTRSNVYTKWSELIGCYALQRIVIGSNSKLKKFKKLESSAVIVFASVL